MQAKTGSSSRPSYPKKLFYRIQEVAEITDLKAHVLRYWETEFKQLAPEKDRNDQRRYREKDIDLVFQIKELLYEQKFTIAGARQQFKPREVRRSRPAKKAKSSRQALLKGIRAELSELMNCLSI
ncbi:MerR family transcriptional regulator [bacterium]|nr:MerR family transcriptional regulator [bacterium]